MSIEGLQAQFAVLDQIRDLILNLNQTPQITRNEERICVVDEFKVTELPEFDGGTDPEDYMEWERKIERRFDSKDMADEKRYKYAILRLVRNASLWYENMKYKRRCDNKEKISSWDVLKRKLRKRYVPKNYKKDLYVKADDLSRGTSSIADYIAEFGKVNMMCDVNEYEEACSIRGLNKSILNVVDLNQSWSKSGNSSISSSKLKSEPKQDNIGSQEIVFVELEQKEEYFIVSEEDGVESELFIAPSDGEFLVIPRSLHLKIEFVDTKHRDQIFHTKCVVNGKWCNVIIDGGSCTNVDVIEMMSDLSLGTKPDLKPQKLHCLNDGGNVLALVVKEESRRESDFSNLEKCSFMVPSVIILGYVISKAEILVNQTKQAAIRSWPTLKNVNEVRLFHGLSYFYHRFICNFSTIIGVVLLQGVSSIGYFCEKYGGARFNYSTYDAIGRALNQLSHYLKPNIFVLQSDHEALKHLNGQQKLNTCHGKWVEFLQSFQFSSKHKDGTSNIIVDALSRRYSLLSTLDVRLLGFEMLKEYYNNDDDFAGIFDACKHGSHNDFSIQDGYLFKGNRLCVPKCAVRELLVYEARGGGIAGYFGVSKTLEIIHQHYFYWQKMQGADQRLIERSVTCQIVKIKFQLGEYMPIPNRFWEDIFMDFVVKLPRTPRGKGAGVVVVDTFLKMAHFIARHKTYDSSYVADLYLNEVVRLHEVPKYIILDRDSKFLSYLWKILWRNLGTKLPFSTSHHPQTVGQAEKSNQFLGTLLKVLIIKMQNERMKILINWLDLRKERFPKKRKNKLIPQAEGPYKILERVNDNAYKLELPGGYRVHATFNVGDLSPYLDDDGLAELRSIPFKEGEDDAGAIEQDIVHGLNGADQHVILNQNFAAIYGNMLSSYGRGYGVIQVHGAGLE